ncbi:MAG: diaminopimelate epimerase, partial [Prevotellaceae bacterium]|nr:diaminopimelate epimerase [Prevotellaceae bacterium]
MENSTIQFTKMHGAGNDYIYVNTLLYNIPDPAKASIEWSKPHFGIGSDGLILIGEATEPDADFSMRIFNNDGSEAMMCGNGTRCVAKFLHDKGLTDKNPIRLQTLSGIKILNLHLDANNKVETVTVDMGEPILKQPAQFGVNGGKAVNWELTAEGRQFIGTFVS